MVRRDNSFERWREWRRSHYTNGDPRNGFDELGPLMVQLLSTRKGAIAVLQSDRRWAKAARRQHTPPTIKDADYLHQAYGRRRRRSSK